MKKEWTDEQLKKLFWQIEVAKKNNKNLLKTFEDFAKVNNKQKFSVRNYYYEKVKMFMQNKLLAQKFGINLSVHAKQNKIKFSQTDSKNLITEIEKQTAKGISVRKACYNLSNGDMNQMVRFQNRYRLEKKCNNIIKMPVTVAQQQLTESDVNSLFLGLLKLVKENAQKSAESKFKMEINETSNVLRKAIVNLEIKEKEMTNLNNEVKNLNKEKNQLITKIEQMRASSAIEISKKIGSSNLNKLKVFSQKTIKNNLQVD
ncbi:MAG: hypothetical protein RR140_03425 [Clostridia bacterium]